MAYEPKTWECGETITIEKLNHMESGIAQASTQADDVSTRLATAENDISVLDARMDKFVSLPEGSTTADAELIDIRVGADGNVYPTAGDAVRGQISDLKSDLADLENVVEIPINKTYSGDAIASNDAIRISQQMLLQGGHTYTYTLTLLTASERPVYVHLRNAGGTSVNSLSLNAGDLTKSKVYTPTEDIEVYITLSDVNRAVSYIITIADGDSNNRIDRLQGTVDGIKTFTGETDGLAFTNNAYILTPSQGGVVDLTPVIFSGCACASVPCNEGDLFTLYGTPRDNSATRAYMWVKGANGRCFYRHDDTTVLDGDVIVAPVTGTLVINFSMSAPYSAYKGIRNLHNHIITNINDIESIVNSPLETMPEYIMNDMAYKPLGQLQNPYLCLSCDDGSAELETYTIPMLLDKDVPCTFGLWATHSEYGATPVFSPSVVLRTQSGIDAVLSAVENGCEVAQHGTVEWTDMSEAELNSFFDREKAAFADMGITVKGAICPSHCVNNKVRAITGGRFGSVRSGYNGYKSKEDQQNHIAGDVFAPYGFLTGARSNCYSYTSFNTIDKTLAELKALLDNAIANNMCMIVYWHDWDLTADQKATLEAFIDYAKTTTVNFCTLSQIPTLV